MQDPFITTGTTGVPSNVWALALLVAILLPTYYFLWPNIAKAGWMVGFKQTYDDGFPKRDHLENDEHDDDGKDEDCELYDNCDTPGNGLFNRGNTCFINSVVQCLRLTPGFVPALKRVLQETSTPLVDQESETLLSGAKNSLQVAQSLVRLMSELNSKIVKTINPDDFLSSLVECTHLVTKSNQEQQDAEEFLSILLSSFHDAFKSRTPPSEKKEWLDNIQEQCIQQIHRCSSSSPETYSAAVRILGDLEWKKFLQQNNSFITELFYGQMVRGSLCMSCSELSCRHEVISLLQMDVFKSSSRYSAITLQDCLRQYFLSERLSLGNQRMCHGICNDLTSCETQVLFDRIPQRLIIHLKRFEHSRWNRHLTKLRTKILFPITGLDMTAFQFVRDEEDRCMYDLYAVCAHVGSSLSSGHYVAYAKAGEAVDVEAWFKYEDESVSRVSVDELKEETLTSSYLLFYTSK